MNKKPLGSSTPNYYQRVPRRRGVHSYSEEENLSPVAWSGTTGTQTKSPTSKRRTFRTSSDLEDTDESEDEQTNTQTGYETCSISRSYSNDGFPQHKRGEKYIPECNRELSSLEHKSKQNVWNLSPVFVLLVVTVVIIAIATLSISSDKASTNSITRPISLDSIKKEFPLQDPDFWVALETGLEDVIRFEKPSVFLFLYKEDDQNSIDRILANISSYASCILSSNCEGKPIILSSEDVNNNELFKYDSGYLLTSYKSDLETQHIMIVKNLENIPGYVAKVLHSFCDEISPAVKRSVFFLTMKVPEFPDKELKYVRSQLKEKWRDIKEDHFEPLFARISGMILSIKS